MYDYGRHKNLQRYGTVSSLLASYPGSFLVGGGKKEPGTHC